MDRRAPTHEVTPIEHGQLGWVNYGGAGLPTHVVPTWDIRGHVLDEHGTLCACRPTRDEGYDLITHNAFDGRERYEQGRAKRH